MRVFVLLSLLSAMVLRAADDEPVPDEKPDAAAVEKQCIEMLANVTPVTPRLAQKATVMNFPDGRAMWGSLFDKNEVVALVSFHRSPNDVFDYPPNWLSLLAWQGGRWQFRQLLGNASSFDIHRRTYSGLQIVQGYCQTERHSGEQSSWKYDAKTKRLVTTGLDDWGPYAIKGDYICYQRGHERLAHWDTHWIYQFLDGKRGKMMACLHQDDEGRFAVSFLDQKTKRIQTWGFRADQDNESHVQVHSADDLEDLHGKGIGVLTLSKDESLAPEYCFELLTGLSTQLLTDDWTEKVARPVVKRFPIEATGDAEVVRLFQWPQSTKKPTQ